MSCCSPRNVIVANTNREPAPFARRRESEMDGGESRSVHRSDELGRP